MSSHGKTVVVTGGAKGIGLATALAFHRDGAWVFVVDSDAEALDRLPTTIVKVRADLSNASEVRNACENILAKAVTIHVLVNNAGIGGEWRSIFETPDEEWDHVLNVNLRAYWLTAKYLGRSMPGGSAIVNIASTRALQSEPNTEPYAASKGGVVTLTHALSISLASRHIRVNSISPGWIDVRPDKSEPLREIDHLQHPAGRVGTPEDVAAAALFLSSDAAGFITGENLVVDGGMTRKMIYAE